MYCSNDFFCSYNSPLFFFFVAETIILFAFSHQSVDANFRQKNKGNKENNHIELRTI